MKRIFLAIAIGVASVLSLGAASMSDEDDPDCVSTTDLLLQAEEFDESALGNYEPELVGTLTNTSSTQSYDDVSIRVNYYDEQGEVFASEVVEIDKDIEPGETEEFDVGLNPPYDVDHGEFVVECAEHDKSLIQNLKFWDW